MDSTAILKPAPTISTQISHPRRGWSFEVDLGHVVAEREEIYDDGLAPGATSRFDDATQLFLLHGKGNGVAFPYRSKAALG